MNELTRIAIAEAKARLMRGESLAFVDTCNAKAWEQAEDKLPHAVRVSADDVEHYLGKIPRGESLIQILKASGNGIVET